MDKIDEKISCAFCGKEVDHREAWPHVDGDFKQGVRKIDYFCCENHKFEFFNS